MKLKRFSIGTLGLLAVSGFAWSCSTKSDDCNQNLNCEPYDGVAGIAGTAGGSGASGSSGTSGKGGSMSAGTSSTSGSSGTTSEGGTDASAGSGGAPVPECDGTLSPDVDACVISDKYGVFVAPTGNDSTGDGTQAHPFATLTTALSHIEKLKKHVYVCSGEYTEPDMLKIPDRVSIYGRFSCDGSWNYDSATSPAFLHVASPIGATIADAKTGVVIQDLRIDAADAPENGTGANSFGLMITNSLNITLKHVEIHAGKGGKGKDGADGASGLDGVASGADQNGTAGSCSSPPASRVGPQSVPKICESQGGAGGTARVATDYAPTQDGASGYLVSPTNGGKGGDVLGQSAKPGQPGDNGVPGESGASASMTGVFSKDGYMVASGGNGNPGKPGFGGGGGGASLGWAGSTTCVGATGGAGGMGGCGGDPGGGGVGGGASVALLSWQSVVTLETCTLSASTGGAGGKGGTAHTGGAGKVGGAGGPPDAAHTVGTGGNGGNGGYGGNGGSGAGGTGGPSIALVYDGTAPTRLGASVLTFASTAAAGGKGGTLGAVSAPDGTKGLTQDVYTKL
jgi:hypothetical protein